MEEGHTCARGDAVNDVHVAVERRHDELEGGAIDEPGDGDGREDLAACGEREVIQHSSCNMAALTGRELGLCGGDVPAL